jgi:inosose dehydratase
MVLFDRLGVSAINWINENETLFELDYCVDDILAEMLKLGYAGTEMSRKFPHHVHELKELMRKYQLCLTSGWISIQFSDPSLRESEMQKYKKHVDFLKAMGCKHVVTCEERDQFTGQNGELVVPLTEQEWEHMIEGLHEAGRYCKENDMQLVYHFHGETVIESSEEIQKLIKMTDPELVHLLYDTGHAYYGGNDPLDILKKYYDRIKYIHLKDVRQEVLDWKREHHVKFIEAVKRGVFTVPGDGCIDFTPIIQELSDRKYDGWIIVEAEQDPAKANPYENALKAKTYLLKLLGSENTNISSHL